MRVEFGDDTVSNSADVNGDSKTSVRVVWKLSDISRHLVDASDGEPVFCC